MFKSLTIEELGSGALIERANQVMQEVVANIHDLNTDATVTREVNIKVKFNADKTRQFVQTTVYVSGKMAPPRAVGMMLVSDCKDGVGRLYGSNPNQTQLFDQPRTEEEDMTTMVDEAEEAEAVVVETIQTKNKPKRR